MEPCTKDIVNWPGDKRIASNKIKRTNLRVNFNSVNETRKVLHFPHPLVQ